MAGHDLRRAGCPKACSKLCSPAFKAWADTITSCLYLQPCRFADPTLIPCFASRREHIARAALCPRLAETVHTLVQLGATKNTHVTPLVLPKGVNFSQRDTWMLLVMNPWLYDHFTMPKPPSVAPPHLPPEMFAYMNMAEALDTLLASPASSLGGGAVAGVPMARGGGVSAAASQAPAMSGPSDRCAVCGRGPPDVLKLAKCGRCKKVRTETTETSFYYPSPECHVSFRRHVQCCRMFY